MKVIRQFVRLDPDKTRLYTIDGTPECLDIYPFGLFGECVVEFTVVEFPELPTPSDMISNSRDWLSCAQAYSANCVQANEVGRKGSAYNQDRNTAHTSHGPFRSVPNRLFGIHSSLTVS